MLEIHDWNQVAALTDDQEAEATPVVLKLWCLDLLSFDDVVTYFDVRGYSADYVRSQLALANVMHRAPASS